MNPNQEIYPFNFYIPPISSLQNPTPNDFERLIERYQRYFFFIIINKEITQELELRKSLYKIFQRYNLHITTCGKRLPQ